MPVVTKADQCMQPVRTVTRNALHPRQPQTRFSTFNHGSIVRGPDMAEDSYFENMVIDTPEAAANIEELVESGVMWKRGNTKCVLVDADNEVVRKTFEKYKPASLNADAPR